uniref:ARAD1B22264p n=1 Tax=Blastobotrys adeninivorans TaxID=409370 RepID=A0A060TD72_BLAAD
MTGRFRRALRSFRKELQDSPGSRSRSRSLDSSPRGRGRTGSNSDEADDQVDDEIVPLENDERRIDYDDANSIIGGHSVKDENNNEKQTFWFSLPFSNPLAGIDLPSFRLRSIFRSETDPVDPFKLTVLDSRQEEEEFRHVREQDNSRLRAVRHSLLPNLSIDMLNPLATPKDEFPAIDGDVVILGGYRGSILRDRETGRRVWIPIKVGLNLRRIDLTVGITDQDEIEMEKKVYPDGMLTHIGPVDVSRKLIRKLQSSPKCNVHEFSYDWRLSCSLSSQKLVEFLKAIQEKQKTKRKIIVIAHSMGGLIAHHAMQKHPELFRGLIYAGVPSSCPNILGPLRYGDSVLLSSKVLTAKVNFLMRSSFVFLPLDGRCFVDRKDTTIRYDLDFFDVKTWIEYGLSPCVAESLDVRRTQTNSYQEEAPPTQKRFISEMPKLPTRARSQTFTLPDNEMIPYDDAVEYLDRTLKKTKQFLMELEYDPAKADQYPPLVELYGFTVPTLRGSRVNGPEGIKAGDYNDLVFGPGDGVVYHKSLMPEGKGFEPVLRQPSDRGHVNLLNDVDGVGKALNAILQAEKEKLNRNSNDLTT